MHTEQNNLMGKDGNAQPSWFALYTRHKHEKVVARALEGKGLETFLPLYATTRRWQDRTKVISLPLFPCYVFLRGGVDRRLDILTTPGVHSIVSTAGQPAAIPSDVMDGVRRTAESGARVDPHPFLKHGESVRIKSGVLAGVKGILVRKKNVLRLVVSVEILGKAVAVEVDADLVEKLSEERRNISAVVRGQVFVN